MHVKINGIILIVDQLITMYIFKIFFVIFSNVIEDVNSQICASAMFVNVMHPLKKPKKYILLPSFSFVVHLLLIGKFQYVNQFSISFMF